MKAQLNHDINELKSLSKKEINNIIEDNKRLKFRVKVLENLKEIYDSNVIGYCDEEDITDFSITKNSTTCLDTFKKRTNILQSEIIAVPSFFKLPNLNDDILIEDTDITNIGIYLGYQILLERKNQKMSKITISPSDDRISIKISKKFVKNTIYIKNIISLAITLGKQYNKELTKRITISDNLNNKLLQENYTPNNKD